MRAERWRFCVARVGAGLSNSGFFGVTEPNAPPIACPNVAFFPRSFAAPFDFFGAVE